MRTIINNATEYPVSDLTVLAHGDDGVVAAAFPNGGVAIFDEIEDGIYMMISAGTTFSEVQTPAEIAKALMA
jgi:hypothetical protein